MNRLIVMSFAVAAAACTSQITEEQADSRSSAAVARMDRCNAPLLERKLRIKGGYLYTWKCAREDDGSQRELEVTVFTNGKVELLSMTTSPDDPLLDLHLKDK